MYFGYSHKHSEIEYTVFVYTVDNASGLFASADAWWSLPVAKFLQNRRIFWDVRGRDNFSTTIYRIHFIDFEYRLNIKVFKKHKLSKLSLIKVPEKEECGFVHFNCTRRPFLPLHVYGNNSYG